MNSFDAARLSSSPIDVPIVNDRNIAASPKKINSLEEHISIVSTQKIVAVTNPLPEILKDILHKLEILSEIREGQKLNLSTMTYSEGGTLWSSVERWIYGESRSNLIFNLEKIVNQAISYIEDFKNDDDFALLLIKALYRARFGIDNLSKTYCGDPNTLAKIRVILTNIDVQLRENHEMCNSKNGVNIPTSNPYTVYNNFPKL